MKVLNSHKLLQKVCNIGRRWERNGYLGLVSSRLSASQSLIKGFNLHACRRGGTFAPPKVPKSGLGLRPKNLRTGTPARNGCAVLKRGLNGAYRVSQTHLPPSPPLPRSGGGGSCPTFCLSYFIARQVPSALGIRGKLTHKC